MTKTAEQRAAAAEGAAGFASVGGCWKQKEALHTAVVLPLRHPRLFNSLGVQVCTQLAAFHGCRTCTSAARLKPEAVCWYCGGRPSPPDERAESAHSRCAEAGKLCEVHLIHMWR